MLYYLLPFCLMLFLYLNKYSSWIFKEVDSKGFIPCGKCSTTFVSLLLYLSLFVEFTFVNFLTISTFVLLNPLLFVITTKFINKD